MRYSRKVESKPLMMKKILFGIEEILNRQQVKQQAKKNRRKLLKLGPHLLNDLGLNSKGYPIKPSNHKRW
jgi:hypothetical protein